MSGFTLHGFHGRIPCPWCDSVDCAGVRGGRLLCSTHHKLVSAKQLRAMAFKVGLARYRGYSFGNGWSGRYVIEEDSKDPSIKRGEVLIQHVKSGYRGTAPMRCSCITHCTRPQSPRCQC